MATEIQKNKNGLPEFTKAKQLEWKRKMLLFSFFLAIAIIIWFLNALNKNYTTEIKYPVSYSRFPESKLLISDVPDHLVLKVNAHGYALLSYKLSNRPVPINIPVSSFAMNTLSGDSTKSYMLTRYAREQVARQLPHELQLLEIAPDTLFFQFGQQVSRMLKVEADILYDIDRQFTIVNKILISPDSLLVSGPDVYLDTITKLKTKQIALGTLGKSYKGTLELIEYPGMNYSKDKVSCTIELEKLTEVQVDVPIQINGLPDSLRLQTFPQKLKITGQIGLSNYERIVPEAFWAEVKFEDVKDSKSRLQVYLRTKPENLTVVNYYPQTVEYLLSVK